VAEVAADSSDDESDYQAEQAIHELIISDRYAEALPLLKPLCERNSGYAYLILGGFYDTGTEVPVDKQEALRCYRKAIEAGYDRAYLNVGHLLDGLGDLEGARAAYEAGAARDNLPCMYWIGTMMLDGEGGAIDPTQGRVWLQKAADEGHYSARRRLIGIEMRETGTIGARAIAGFRILKLAVKGAQEVWRDPESDRLK
jgi:TPR repeat protein